MKNNTVFVKGNLKVHIRWANVTDASNIARLELNASHYENRGNLLPLLILNLLHYGRTVFLMKIIGQCLLVVQKISMAS